MRTYALRDGRHVSFVSRTMFIVRSSARRASCGRADTMMLFARANVVVLLRNAGREMVDVQPVARVLDARIVAQGRYT